MNNFKNIIGNIWEKKQSYIPIIPKYVLTSRSEKKNKSDSHYLEQSWKDQKKKMKKKSDIKSKDYLRNNTGVKGRNPEKLINKLGKPLKIK